MMLTMDPRLMLGDRYSMIYYTYLVTIYLRGDWEQFSRRYKAMMVHFPGEAHEHSPEVFAALIEKIKAEGFQDYYPVLANPQNYFVVNGEHRCAISIALGIDRITYSLVFHTDEVARSFFDKQLLTPDEVRELDTFFETLLAKFPPDVAKTIRMRQLIRTFDKHFRDAPWASNTLFPSARTYQGIGGLCGKRNTEKRWDEYGLEKHLRGGDEALEIGCNVGFFTSMLSKHVKHADAFDIDPIYVEVAKAYNDGDNTSFHIARFEDLRTDRQYDVIVCCAVHGWVSVGFGDFVMTLFSLLKADGIILFESHEILCEPDWPQRRALLEASCQVLHRGYIDDVDHSLYMSEIREHMILRPQARGQELGDLIRRYGFTLAGGTPSLPAAQRLSAPARAVSDFPVKVSVVLPTYNHAKFLPVALHSIFAQTYDNFELIVVNDGSTDNTAELLAGIRHPKLRVINKINNKLPAALNTGFAEAKGEYFTWTSADNIVGPTWLEELVGALDASPPDVGYALSYYATMDDQGQILKICNDQCFETHSMFTKNGNASFLYRSDLARQAGDYDASLNGAEDLDLWLRMSTMTRAVLVESVLYYYRVHDDSMSARIPDGISEATRRTYLKFLNASGGRLNVDTLFPHIAQSAKPAVARWQARIWLVGQLANNAAWPVDVLVDLLSQCLAEQHTAALVGNIVHLYAARGAWGQAAEAVALFHRKDETAYMQTLAGIVARKDSDALRQVPFFTFSDAVLTFNPHTQLSRAQICAASARR